MCAVNVMHDTPYYYCQGEPGRSSLPTAKIVLSHFKAVFDAAFYRISPL